jgi:hypothetical protein
LEACADAFIDFCGGFFDPCWVVAEVSFLACELGGSGGDEGCGEEAEAGAEGEGDPDHDGWFRQGTIEAGVKLEENV